MRWWFKNSNDHEALFGSQLVNEIMQENNKLTIEIEKMRRYIQALEEEYYKRTNENFLDSKDGQEFKLKMKLMGIGWGD